MKWNPLKWRGLTWVAIVLFAGVGFLIQYLYNHPEARPHPPATYDGTIKTITRHDDWKNQYDSTIDIVVTLDNGSKVGMICEHSVFDINTQYERCIPLEVGDRVTVRPTEGGSGGWRLR